MAKRQSTKPIPPFPDDIDRAHFASWLSGFTDGEGSFCLGINKVGKWLGPHACLAIGVRDDDAEAIQLIQSYFSCGNITRRNTKRQEGVNRQPQSAIKIRKIKDIFMEVVPHFDRYPLIAKKKRDYAVWREGIMLLWKVWARPHHYKKGGGREAKWTQEELDAFRGIMNRLNEQRQYSGPGWDG